MKKIKIKSEEVVEVNVAEFEKLNNKHLVDYTDDDLNYFICEFSNETIVVDNTEGSFIIHDFPTKTRALEFLEEML